MTHRCSPKHVTIVILTWSSTVLHAHTNTQKIPLLLSKKKKEINKKIQIKYRGHPLPNEHQLTSLAICIDWFNWLSSPALCKAAGCIYGTTPVILHIVHHLRLGPLFNLQPNYSSCSDTVSPSALAEKTFSLAINYHNSGKMHKARVTPFLFPLINILKQLHYNNVFWLTMFTAVLVVKIAFP